MTRSGGALFCVFGKSSNSYFIKQIGGVEVTMQMQLTTINPIDSIMSKQIIRAGIESTSSCDNDVFIFSFLKSLHSGKYCR